MRALYRVYCSLQDNLGIAKKNPYAQVGLTLSSIAIDTIIDNVFQPHEFSNFANQVQDRQLQLRNKNNVVVVEDETDETNIGGSLPVGDASSLLVVSSSNLDNPYLANSYIQYIYNGYEYIFTKSFKN